MSKWKSKFNWQEIKGDIEKERSKNKKSWNDDRFWRPDWKAAVEQGKFYKFRFLPDQEGNPFIKYFTHNFSFQNVEGNGKKWYINNCISTFGWDPACPICDKNSDYWDSPYDSDKEIARERGRRVNFVSNVLIIDDPIHPENNGKIFLYSYGVKIFAKIEKLMFPTEADLQDEDFVPFIPFDLEEGASFKLKIVMQGDYPNYDTSEWSPRSPACKTDEELDAVMEAVVSLNEFVDPSKYPSIEETLVQVGHLLGVGPSKAEDTEGIEDTESKETTTEDPPWKEDNNENPFMNGSQDETSTTEDKNEEVLPQTTIESKPVESTKPADDDDGDDEDFFKNLK